jgi:hypothetical protein
MCAAAAFRVDPLDEGIRRCWPRSGWPAALDAHVHKTLHRSRVACDGRYLCYSPQTGSEI